MKIFQIDKLGVYKIKPLENKIFFNGLYYYESNILFKSKDSYKIIIKYHYKEEDYILTIERKGYYVVNLPIDVFEIDIIEKPKDFVIVVSNMKDYFFDLISDN